MHFKSSWVPHPQFDSVISIDNLILSKVNIYQLLSSGKTAAQRSPFLGAKLPTRGGDEMSSDLIWFNRVMRAGPPEHCCTQNLPVGWTFLIFEHYNYI